MANAHVVSFQGIFDQSQLLAELLQTMPRGGAFFVRVYLGPEAPPIHVADLEAAVAAKLQSDLFMALDPVPSLLPPGEGGPQVVVEGDELDPLKLKRLREARERPREAAPLPAQEDATLRPDEYGTVPHKASVPSRRLEFTYLNAKDQMLGRRTEHVPQLDQIHLGVCLGGSPKAGIVPLDGPMADSTLWVLLHCEERKAVAVSRDQVLLADRLETLVVTGRASTFVTALDGHLIQARSLAPGERVPLGRSGAFEILPGGEDIARVVRVVSTADGERLYKVPQGMRAEDSVITRVVVKLL